jgi:hypothetical protein
VHDEPGRADPPRAACRSRAAHRDWARRLAGTGLVARSALYAVLAVLALQVAVGGDDSETDSEGALAAIARQHGKILLALPALGFAFYALWRTVGARHRSRAARTTR